MKKMLALCAVSALSGAVVAIVLYDPPKTERETVAQESGSWAPVRAEDGPATALERADYEGLTAEERVNVAVYESGNLSVVNISTRSVQTDSFMRQTMAEGEGSGTVIDRKGHILTNFHVVEGARDIRVTLFNGKAFDAQIIGGDEASDVAVLRIDAPEDCLYPVTFGNSSGLLVGQRVFAIGNPFGLERTLSTGVISSLNRTLPRRHLQGTIKSIIQIDASINPGSSGGPLLDSRGRMIGMNAAIASKTGESAGVGFAIPVNTIAWVVPQLIASGRVVRADIGLVGYQTKQGLLIAALASGGPADKAGLQGPKLIIRQRRQGPFVYQYRTIDRSAADLIVAVDGKTVRSNDDLVTIVESKKPGDEVIVTVLRDGSRKQISVQLEADE